MSRHMRRTGYPMCVGVLIGVLATGCGRPDEPTPARVSGQVTFQGRPLAGGLIVFVPNPERSDGGRLFSAALDGGGRFALADGATTVPAGWYRVVIAEPAGSYELGFPAVLRRPDRSGLEREIQPGHDHHFEFHIEPLR